MEPCFGYRQSRIRVELVSIGVVLVSNQCRSGVELVSNKRRSGVDVSVDVSVELVSSSCRLSGLGEQTTGETG